MVQHMPEHFTARFAERLNGICRINVKEAAGKDALAKLSGSIGLIMSDVNMPEMNGIELVRSVRASGTYKYVPILMLTTESQPAMKQEGKAAGATG